MNMTLHSLVIPSADKVIATHFYCRIFCFETVGKHGKYIRLKVNDELFLDFSTASEFNVQRFSFKVDEATFDEIYINLDKEGLMFGSSLDNLEDNQLNFWHQGRGLFFRDPSGHIIELLTKSE